MVGGQSLRGAHRGLEQITDGDCDLLNRHCYPTSLEVSEKRTNIVYAKCYKNPNESSTFLFKHAYVPVISKTLEHIETFNTNQLVLKVNIG